VRLKLDSRGKMYSEEIHNRDARQQDGKAHHESKSSSRTVRAERQQERPDVIQQAMPVPFHKIGWIVGRRGSYITQLTRKSGANISISDSESREYGTVWKYIMISGTGREVDRAKKVREIRYIYERYPE
jgi:polyribonucleotide nucleotidyltransferase